MAITGGTESVICPLAVGGFGAMKALSTRNDDPQAASRPFDLHRDGLVISEGSGMLVRKLLINLNGDQGFVNPASSAGADFFDGGES